MNIVVDGSALDLTLMSMGTVPVLDPKKDFETGKQKLSDDGKPLWVARALSAVQFRDGLPTGADASVSLSVTEQPEGGLVFGRIYRLVGPTKVVHYVQENNRLGVSITATAVQQVQPNNKKE